MIYGFIAPFPLNVTSMNWHPLPATVSTYLIFKYLIISLGSTSNSYEFKYAPFKLFDDNKIQFAFCRLSELVGGEVTEFPEELKMGSISALYKSFRPQISSFVGVFPEKLNVGLKCNSTLLSCV